MEENNVFEEFEDEEFEDDVFDECDEEQDECRRERDNKHKRKWKYKKKLEKMADRSSKYPYAAYRVDNNNHYTDNPEETKYVKRDYRSHISSYLKKLASRKFRRYKDDLSNGCAYKKLFDYWWELT